MPPLPIQWRQLTAFARHIWQQFGQDDCSRSAAALTYMTLFAVVPLMTVMYAMASAIPTFEQLGDQIQSYIFQHFVPATGLEVQSYLLQFSQQARRLTGAGVGFLVITAVLMMRNIEKTFNAIWHTQDNRSLLNSFLLYWAILSLGPLCIGLALGISTYLLSVKALLDPVQSLGLGGLGLALLPGVLTALAFTLLFAAVPNCRVPLPHAALGGVLCAVVMELAKQLFAAAVARTSYEVIYGAFAAIPLFLMWIYLSWVIVLLGAEVVHALSGFDTHQSRRLPDWAVCLALLERLWRHHRRGALLSERSLLHGRWLPGNTSLGADRWATLRDKLLSAGLIQPASGDNYLLGRDLSQVTFNDILQLLQSLPTHYRGTTDNAPWLQRAQEQLSTLDNQVDNHLRIPLTQLFGEDDAVDQPTAKTM